MTRDLRSVRLIAGAQTACGLALALLPRRTARVVCAGRAQPDARVVRGLGIRLLAQQVWLLRAPTRARLLTGALVDAVHGASMVAVAALRPTYGRAASVSAAHACAAGLAEALAAARAGR